MGSRLRKDPIKAAENGNKAVAIPDIGPKPGGAKDRKAGPRSREMGTHATETPDTGLSPDTTKSTERVLLYDKYIAKRPRLVGQ